MTTSSTQSGESHRSRNAQRKAKMSQSRTKATTDDNIHSSARKSAGDPSFDFEFRPRDGARAKLMRLRKCAHLHKAIDRRSAEADPALDLRQPDQAERSWGVVRFHDVSFVGTSRRLPSSCDRLTRLSELAGTPRGAPPARRARRYGARCAVLRTAPPGVPSAGRPGRSCRRSPPPGLPAAPRRASPGRLPCRTAPTRRRGPPARTWPELVRLSQAGRLRRGSRSLRRS